MSEDLYRLTFRGELQEGQHAAVAMKKLGALLKLEPERIKKMFDGEVVIIKKSVDKVQAARFQTVFKTAGVRLRVARIVQVGSEDTENKQSLTRGQSESVEQPESDVSAASTSVDDSAFSLAPAKSQLKPDITPESEEEINTDHLDMAEPGVDLLADEFKAEMVIQPLEINEVDWEVSALGTNLLDNYPEAEMAIDISTVNFDLAELGSLMDQRSESKIPAVPDISHISLKD
ncbi:MAG: hypothetical protein KUG75_00020 [Pseudomonadales bacterium]|nr:hypothetical protein [Pseudomonadales bacterium]